jgi:hypothetical protein
VTKTASGSSDVEGVFDWAGVCAVFPLGFSVVLGEAQAAVMASTPAVPAPTETRVINLRRVNFAMMILLRIETFWIEARFASAVLNDRFNLLLCCFLSYWYGYTRQLPMCY